MFESVIATMLKHKQIVIAAIAVTAIAGYAFPLNQVASATSLAEDLVGGIIPTDDNDDGTEERTDTQELEQTNRADVDQDITAPNTQTQTNEQANVIDTGDADADQTQTIRDVTTASSANSAAEGGSADDGSSWSGHDDWKKKKDDHKKSDCCKSSSDDSGGDASSSSTSSASTSITANPVNVADTSADNNFQQNNADFAPQTNVQDLDNRADIDQINAALQLQDNYFNVDRNDD